MGTVTLILLLALLGAIFLNIQQRKSITRLKQEKELQASHMRQMQTTIAALNEKRNT